MSRAIAQEIFEAIIEMGYRGKDTKGRYVTSMGKHSSAEAMTKKLGVSKSLPPSLLGYWLSDPSVPNEVYGLLDSEKLVTPISGAQASDVLPDHKDQSKLFKEGLVIFKSGKLLKHLDPVGHRRGQCFIVISPSSRRVWNEALPGKASIDTILNSKGLSREAAIESPDIPVVLPYFNPYTPDLTFNKWDEDLDMDIMYLNTAPPPRWMKDFFETPPEFSGFIKKLFFHLFPIAEDRERVLDWCHYALLDRNETVLVLAGDRGTGKSTFVEVMGHVIGNEFLEMAGEAVLEDKFNSQFMSKRIIAFEEIALSEDKHINKVKSWCNKKIAVEAKGMDAITVENFTSMIFLTNNVKDLKIAPQERRFSIPEVAEENLNTTISEKEIDFFKKGLEEETPEALVNIAKFGNFLRTRKPKSSKSDPIKGSNFFKVTESSLSEWQQKIREEIGAKGIVGEAIHISQILPMKDDARAGIPTRRDTIATFLADYRYMGKYKIGDVVDCSEDPELRASQKDRKRRTYGIIPRAEFMAAYAKSKIIEVFPIKPLPETLVEGADLI